MSNESTSAALGSFHYHTGEYGRSATFFSSAIEEAKSLVPRESRFQDGFNSSNDSRETLSRQVCYKIGKEERDHLTLLSLEADEALCRFRSAKAGRQHQHQQQQSFSKTDSKESTADRTDTDKGGKDATAPNVLWKRARVTNQKLWDDLNKKVCKMWCNCDLASKNDTFDLSINQMYVASACRIQLSQSILMTGISASWLDLQEPSELKSTMKSTNHENNNMAIDTLHHSICLAAFCFLPHSMKKTLYPSESYFISALTSLPWKEGWLIVTQVFAFLVEQCTKNGAEPLNSLELAFNSDKICVLNTCILEQDDLERIQVVMRSVEQMLNVVKLSNGSLGSLERCDDKRSLSTHDGKSRPTKRQKRCSTNEKLFIDSTLDVKEALFLALYHHSQIGSKPHHCKLRNDNLDVALSIDQGGLSRRIYSFVLGLDMLEGRSVGSEEEILVLKTLDTLAPTCVNAAQLLACLLAQKGHFERSLTIFQELLEQISLQKHDAKSNVHVHLFHKNIILSYMAYCFVMLGEAEPAVELFLQVINDDQCVNSVDQKEKDNAIQCQQAEYHDLNNHSITVHVAGTRKLSLLWNLFQAASLTNDLETCTRATRLLKDLSPQNGFTSLVFAYSCLKTGLMGDAQSIFEALKLDDSKSRDESILNHCKNTYEANAKFAKLMMTGGAEKNDDVTIKELPDVPISIKDDMKKLTRMSMERLRFIEDEWSNAAASNFFRVRVWKACVLNNHGVSLVADGKLVEAMSFFLSATFALPQDTKSSSDYQIMEPFFNLSLLLWRQEQFLESSNVWLKARGIISSSERRAVRVLKEKRDSAVAAYVAAIKDQDVQNISIGTENAALNLNYIILDMLILRYVSKQYK